MNIQRSENGARGQPIGRYLGKSYNGAGGEDGTFEYKELPRPGTVEEVDTEAIAAFCVDGDRREFVSYDNPATVKAKGEWAREQDLGVSLVFPLLSSHRTIFLGF